MKLSRILFFLGISITLTTSLLGLEFPTWALTVGDFGQVFTTLPTSYPAWLDLHFVTGETDFDLITNETADPN